jgi:hypothetical protein
LSDFHEMANNLRIKKERSLRKRDPACIIDKGGRRLGIERRQFAYSHYLPERRLGTERRLLSERRESSRSEQ